MDKLPEMHERLINGDNLDRVLAMACRTKLRVKIAVGADHFPFYSRMTELRDDEIYLTGLQPTSPREEEELLIGSEVDIVFPLDRREHFVGRMLFIGRLPSLSGPLLYHVKRPKSMSYLVKRRAERFEPNESLPVTCLSIGDNKMSGLVKVKNISIDGISLLLPGDIPMEVGEAFPPVRLKLAPNTYVTLSAELRHRSRDDKGETFVGLMWEPMSKQQYDGLYFYLNNLIDSIRRQQEQDE